MVYLEQHQVNGENKRPKFVGTRSSVNMALAPLVIYSGWKTQDAMSAVRSVTSTTPGIFPTSFIATYAVRTMAPGIISGPRFYSMLLMLGRGTRNI